jgi:hypothetical protein
VPSSAGTVMTRAASMLNDASQLTFTSGILLPFFNAALDELEAELAVYELSPLISDSLEIDVDIDDDTLAQMPTDFVEAISLLERPRNSDQDWIEVKEVADINDNIDNDTGILQWTSRGPAIHINPPQSEREVKLSYVRGLVAATGSGTAIDIEVSRHFLALVTARNAALDLGNSASKGALFEQRIALARDRLTRRLQKGNQSVSGVRRLPYTGRSRR